MTVIVLSNWVQLVGMGQTSIPCTKEVRDELAETKPDGMSWSEYLIALRDESDQLKQSFQDDVNPDLVAEQVVDLLSAELLTVDQMDRIEDAVTTVEQRTGSIERTLEGMKR